MSKAEEYFKEHKLGNIDYGSNPIYFTKNKMIAFAKDFADEQNTELLQEILYKCSLVEAGYDNGAKMLGIINSYIDPT